MQLFRTARIKLTFWYVVIIMTVSLFFSAVIYSGATNEFERQLTIIENRLELRRYGLLPPAGNERFFLQDLIETRNRFVVILLYTNAGILLVSTMAGFFLAGKTLRPIEVALENQKRFVADASHELRTPLTSLHTSIEVALRDNKLNLKSAKSTLKEALTDIQDLDNLTSDLLILARSGSYNLKKEIVHLDEVYSILYKRFSPLANKKSIRLEIKNTSSSVVANTSDITKILSILIDNAIKYTPAKGKVYINTKKHRRTVTISVIDDGDGITDNDLPKIFDRFFRSDEARTKSKTSGFGLGLSIAKELADRNDIDLSVKSKFGIGTTFTLTLHS